ncbi:MAG TPA: hypothetical protein ENJ95_10885 [Bacteroidetes bacterium]|nr:hypothetical protein [Bacteroidota bacterium]
MPVQCRWWLFTKVKKWEQKFGGFALVLIPPICTAKKHSLPSPPAFPNQNRASMKNTTYLLLLLLSVFVFTNCAAVKKQKMAAANEETIRLWFEEGWNHNRNIELLDRVFDPDWSDGNPLHPHHMEGYEGLKELVKFYRKAFPDAQFTITHIFANEKNAAIRYEVKATHLGDAFGIPATGKEFTSTGLVLYEMRDGKIYRSWQELDLMGIINQLKE